MPCCCQQLPGANPVLDRNCPPRIEHGAASAAALFLQEAGLLDNFLGQLAEMDISDIASLERICAKMSNGSGIPRHALLPRVHGNLLRDGH